MKRSIGYIAVVCLAAMAFFHAVAAQKVSTATIQGQLLKSNGRPLSYTEIELVPVTSQKIINDSRLIGVSSTSGKFTFLDVPAGKYTLSINFDDKPTALSPYATYFYPATSKRSEAQVFDITDATRLRGINFKLQPALTAKRITGKVVWPDGTPVAGVLIGCRDLDYDVTVSFGTTKTDALGAFSAEGFVGRKYQVGAILFKETSPELMLGPVDVIAGGESDVFLWDASSKPLIIKIARTKEAQRILDKYLGMMVDRFVNNETL